VPDGEDWKVTIFTAEQPFLDFPSAPAQML
jgi:hypothetical protein